MESNEELVRLYQNGDKQALDKLIKNNRGIIAKLSNKYRWINKRLEFDELFNSGVIGLIKAAQKYNFENENRAKFITFAVFSIDRYIHSCVNGRGECQEKNNKFFNSCVSLNTPVGEERSNTELEEVIEVEDKGFEDVEYKMLLKQLRGELEEVMKDRLTLQQREVIKFRYGWNTNPMTLQEIADIFDISSARVRQVEAKSLRILRHSKWGASHGKEYREQIFGPPKLSIYSVNRELSYMSEYNNQR